MSQDNTVPMESDAAAAARSMPQITISTIYRQIADFYDEALALESAAKLSFTDPRAALDAMHNIRSSGNFTFIEVAILTTIGNNIKCSKTKELDIRKEFYKNLTYYICGASKVLLKSKNGHIPDGFIRVGGMIAPVEIKRTRFDERAKEQLERYMRVYGSKLGIAVAPALTCKLPSNIRFVAVGSAA